MTISPSNPGESPEMKTKDQAASLRESFERAVGRLKPHVYQCDCAFCSNYAAARSRLLQLWDELRAEVERLRAEVADYATLRDAVNEHPGDCDPGCDSHSHTSTCKYCDMANTLIEQQRTIERLKGCGLTDEDADHALTGWLSHGRSRHCVCVECERLREKLTALANLSGSPREGRSDG